MQTKITIDDESKTIDIKTSWGHSEVLGPFSSSPELWERLLRLGYEYMPKDWVMPKGFRDEART